MSGSLPPKKVDIKGDTKPLWTVKDVANYLSLTPETVRAMARRGELPGLKIGRVWRFDKFSIIDQLRGK